MDYNEKKNLKHQEAIIILNGEYNIAARLSHYPQEAHKGTREQLSIQKLTETSERYKLKSERILASIKLLQSDGE